MQPSAKEHDIVLAKDIEENLPQVWLDPEGIYRCLVNLVTNAIDACKEVSRTHKRPEVVLRSLKPDNWAVMYEVEDNGCGMDKETGSRVFQSFFSTKGSRGTGLGLMITKKIIEEHGGIIEMETEKGRGTKFHIVLPSVDRPSE
jgi:signal transduction histidine kinase